MKVTVEMSETEIQEVLKYSGEKMKGPAIRRLAIDELNYRKRLAMNVKFHSGEWAVELPSLDELRKDRPLWDR
jgi:hypothetical protein